MMLLQMRALLFGALQTWKGEDLTELHKLIGELYQSMDLLERINGKR